MKHKHLPRLIRPSELFFDENEEEWDLVPQETSNLSISEDKNSIYVEAALPGLSQEDIEVTFDNNLLWIKGEKKEEKKDKKFYKKAISSFSYRVAVPGEIDEKKEIEASYKNGIMKVTFPKAKKTEPKKITIKKS
jgi:HSP20 family protein